MKLHVFCSDFNYCIHDFVTDNVYIFNECEVCIVLLLITVSCSAQK